MFRQISTRIALQFTGFVFALMLVNGILFLIADFSNERRMSQGRLLRTAEVVLEAAQADLGNLRQVLPPPIRDRVRVIGGDGVVLYGGNLFEELPFEPHEGFSDVFLRDEEYMLFTAPVMRAGRLVGHVQVAGFDRPHRGDIPVRALLYLIVTLGVSGLTYLAGRSFARRSLKPAEAAMQRLEQFTQDASHELRTPLAALRSSLDLALRNGRHEEGLLSAREDVQEVTLLVERLLELARLDRATVDLGPVDLSGLALDAAERHRALAGEQGVSIETEIAPGVTVPGDAALLRQVLGNLLSNAIKFNRTGGKIRIVLTSKVLSVEDTGTGIAPADLPSIFDRFYQAASSRANEGYGLGLALVKRIVDLHGWTIDVKSAPAKGTTFIVRLSGKKQAIQA